MLRGMDLIRIGVLVKVRKVRHNGGKVDPKRVVDPTHDSNHKVAQGENEFAQVRETIRLNLGKMVKRGVDVWQWRGSGGSHSSPCRRGRSSLERSKSRRIGA